MVLQRFRNNVRTMCETHAISKAGEACWASSNHASPTKKQLTEKPEKNNMKNRSGTKMRSYLLTSEKFAFPQGSNPKKA